MGKYTVRISKDAEKDLSILKRSGKKKDIEKVAIIFREIEENPKIGTGKPEQLKHYNGEVWSRRINQKDRFLYEIFEDHILIIVIKVLGHYSDK
jgi:toxin YoeB